MRARFATEKPGPCRSARYKYRDILGRCNLRIGSKGATRQQIKNAGNLLAYAVKTGKVIKPTQCPVCGNTVDNPEDMHAHHFNYDNPLDVRWLCKDCHNKLHKQLRESAKLDRIAGIS